MVVKEGFKTYYYYNNGSLDGILILTVVITYNFGVSSQPCSIGYKFI